MTEFTVGQVARASNAADTGLVKTFTYSDGRREAAAWLAHQLTWERLLTKLREHSTEEQHPVTAAPESRPAAA